MTKLTEKIGKMWEDKTGVSPIIAVILMVAITVVLAATIYVWVSGFGGGGDETPNIACRNDATNDRLEVVSADPDLNWKDIAIITDLDQNNVTIYSQYKTGNITEGDDALVQAGDYIEYIGTTGTTYTLRLVYKPTNSQMGKWTITI
ncbi:MAG TPA: type IV pilin [Thermoplasmatales archaeon]|nr:type IV pilin [Thermoplasmatales archaeon]